MKRPLKLSELKQAISVLFEIEGDIPLLEDQSTLHSDKDIELICGSLLVIRKGTLQVIHLTVKEFLRRTDELRNSPHAGLLVDPRQASMTLTQMCLKYIELNCMHPVTRLKEGIPRIDFRTQPTMIESLRNERPLAEYASFSWLAHLRECEGTQTKEIAKAFLQTFSSEATFNWCELCMTFQPDSVDRLLIGIDELNDWILVSKSDHWFEQDAGCQFLVAWCVALRILFEDFGPVIRKRPWEIHFLDLRSIFHDLEDFYQKYSRSTYRDVNVMLGKSKLTGKLSDSRSDPCSKLQESVQSAQNTADDVFLLHDEIHDLYFWGPRCVQLPYLSLNVQHSRTGCRLPPSMGIIEAGNREGIVESCEMSPDGQFIAIIYVLIYGRDDDLSGPLTVIWKINRALDFSRRMNSQSWARVKFYHFANPKSLRPTSRGVVFAEDYCVTPSGRIATTDNDVLPFLIDPVERSEDDLITTSDYSFDGNGNVYLSERTSNSGWQAKMFSPFGPNAPNLYSWDKPDWRLYDVSTYGRYLVIGNMWDPESSIHLYDTTTRKVEDLVCPDSKIRVGWSTKFHFCQYERKLIVFLPCETAGIWTMNVVIWNDLILSKKPSRSGQLLMDFLIISPFQIFVHLHGNSALIVTSNKSIQEVKLGDEVSFPDARFIDEEYTCNLSKVSHDGRRLALLRYGPRKGRVQIMQLTSNLLLHQIQLPWLECDNPNFLMVAWSQDLSMLVVDAQVFDLTSPPNETIPDPFMISGLTELLQIRRVKADSSHFANLRCQISSCKSFVVYTSPGTPVERETYPSDLLVFRIDLKSRLSTRQQVDLPNIFSFMSVDLHPSLSLMAMCFASATEAHSQDWESEPPQMHLRMLNLESMAVEVIAIPDRISEHIDW